MAVGHRVVALAALVGTAAVAAPDPRPPAALQALVVSAGYQRYVAQIFAHLPPAIFQRCPALMSKDSSVTVIEPASFAPDGYPLSGLWRQSFPIGGCGNDTIVNIFFLGHPDEKITSVVGVPGTTHADLVLQRDALRFATLAVQSTVPGCAKVTIRDSRYDGAAAGGGRSWRESWAATACGAKVRVPMTFIPDATGTTIRAGMAVRGG